MEKVRITLFEGDGIGPEITECLKRVFEAVDAPVEYDEYLIGQRAYEKYGVLIPDDAVESIKRNRIILKAPVTTPVGGGFRSVNVELRLLFDLYANMRPAKTMPGTKSRYDGIDIVTFRENTEDLYTGDEYEIEGGFVARKTITEKCSERIARYAFEYARKYGRKKVTCVHKANILKKTDGLFLDTFRRVAAEYPEIEANDKIVDNMTMNLVMDPTQFDVLVAPNLYGDIITDLIAGLVGGLGMAPAANIGTDTAMFEAVHGSAPDIAGKNIANPTAFILSGAMLLDYIGETGKAERIRNAILKVLTEGRVATADLGGNAGTAEYTDEIIRNL